jgi:hypothetical protein
MTHEGLKRNVKNALRIDVSSWNSLGIHGNVTDTHPMDVSTMFAQLYETQDDIITLKLPYFKKHTAILLLESFRNMYETEILVIHIRYR